MVYTFLVFYAIFLYLIYVLMLRRMKHLSMRHYENTNVVCLKKGYKIIQRRLIILFVVLFIITALLVLHFYASWDIL